MLRLATLAGAGLLLAAALAVPVTAQRPTPIPPPGRDSGSTPSPTIIVSRCDGMVKAGCPAQRFGVGLGLDVAQPLGDFKRNVKVAVGVDFNALVLATPGSPLGLRVSGGFLQYGSERQDLDESGCFCSDPQLHTTYQYAGFQVGPELGLRTGPVRPYIGGTVGYGHFGASAKVDVRNFNSGEGTRAEVWNETLQGDGVFASTGFGGLRIAAGSSVTIDAGARFVHNGEAEYVPKGGVEWGSNGSATVTTVRSKADFVSYTVGASIGFGAKR